jgi:hyperosmotically inducible protein
MRMNRKAPASLALGVLLALAVTGCSTWNRMTGGGSYASASNDAAISTTNEPTGTHRSLGRTAEDAAITAKVKTAFATDPVVKARMIDVDTLRGVVTLYGVVNTPAERERAVSIANRTQGVFEVKDNLKLAG